MSDQYKYYDNLSKIMIKTRNIRFQVSESEKRKEKFSITTITMLSIYIACWSLILAIFPKEFSDFQSKALNLSLVVASVSLLAISIFDYASNRSVFAEQMLQNAFSISKTARETKRQLKNPNPSYERLDDLAQSYEETVKNAGVNHSSIDYNIWKRGGPGNSDHVLRWIA